MIDVDVLLLGDLDYRVRAADAAARAGHEPPLRARAAARARPRSERCPAASGSPARSPRWEAVRRSASPARRCPYSHAPMTETESGRQAAGRRRRQHADPLRCVRRRRRATLPSTGGSRPCASRPPTSSARRWRTCWRCAGSSFADIGGSIVSSTVPQLYDQWSAMAERYLGHEMLMRRPVDQDRHADPDRQPARGRRRPAGQRRRGLRPLQLDLRGRRLRHRDHLRRRLSRRASTSAGSSRRGSRSRSRRSPSAPPSCRRSSWREPRAVIGKSTVEAIRSGIVFGFAGQVEGIVRRLRAELGEETRGDRDRRLLDARCSRSSGTRSTRSTSS